MVDQSDRIKYGNFPYILEEFKDPEDQSLKLILAITVPGGSQFPSMELNEAGDRVTVRYKWNKYMYEADKLFGKQINAKTLSRVHPKVLAIRSGLEKNRGHIDKTPEGFIQVNLPFKVQTGLQSWSKNGVKGDNGEQIIIAEFTGYVKSYNKATSDSTVLFE